MGLIGDTIKKLRLKYNVKREAVTVYLPVFIALVFIAVAVMYTNMGADGTKGKAGAADVFANLEGTGELTEEQLAQLAELKKIKESGGKDPNKNDPLDDIIIFAVLIAIIPYSVDLFFQKRRYRKYEEEYADFLFEVSEMMRSGIDPVKAITELAKSNVGTITSAVRRATSRMTFGKSFDYSMRKLGEELKSNFIIKYTDLVVHASYTGGQVAEIILKSSEDMKKFINLDREKEGNLKLYVVIMYMAQAILLFLAAVFLHEIVPSFSGVNTGMFFSGLGVSSGAKLDSHSIATYSFHVVIINAFFVGLISGKMSTGSMKHGLKHSVILMLASYMVSMFFIFPQAVMSEPVIITPVSYSSSSYVGIPIAEPIILKVTTLGGEPVEGVEVNFMMEGPSQGSFKQYRAKTDREGLVSVQPILGPKKGVYTIKAKVGESIGTVEVEAVTT